MQKYTITSEEESSLFDRRIKLLELIILTITAIIILIPLIKLNSLIWPILILGADIIFIILTILFCANKKKLETTFTDDIQATKLEISYTLHWPDIIAFTLYIFAIITFGIFFRITSTNTACLVLLTPHPNTNALQMMPIL